MSKTATGKAKGRRLQQYVASRILDHFSGFMEPDDCRSNPMGAPGEDILFSPSGRKSLPVSIECKSRKTLPLTPWYQQAKANAPKGIEPILVVKADRQRPLAVVDLDYWLELERIVHGDD